MIGMSTMEVALQRKYQTEVNTMTVEFRKLQARCAELDNRLAMEQCRTEALAASLSAFDAAHPDSPLLAKTGRTLADGEAETVLMRDVWVPAFDQAALDRGCETPIEHRNHVVADLPPPAPVAAPAEKRFRLW